MGPCHESLESIMGDPQPQKIRNGPKIERPLGQPGRSINGQEHPIDVVHGFETVHSIVPPEKSFPGYAILLPLPFDGRPRLAIPELGSIVVRLRSLDEVARLLYRLFGLAR